MRPKAIYLSYKTNRGLAAMIISGIGRPDERTLVGWLLLNEPQCRSIRRLTPLFQPISRLLLRFRIVFFIIIVNLGFVVTTFFADKRERR